MVIALRVSNGHIEEFENGIKQRSYGSNIVAVSTDGRIGAAVT